MSTNPGAIQTTSALHSTNPFTKEKPRNLKRNLSIVATEAKTRSTNLTPKGHQSNSHKFENLFGAQRTGGGGGAGSNFHRRKQSHQPSATANNLNTPISSDKKKNL